MADTRSKLRSLMVATIADHNNWTYQAVRPMPVPLSWKKGQKVRGDCSKGVQYLCLWAGAPDPMGNNFGEYGNSTTICMHLKHVVQPNDLEVGDIVTFGPGGDEHAAMVMEAGSDPMLWSFGHQGAPNSYRLSADTRQRQYLHLPVPPIVITPEQKLRQETGYWAWVQWKLGEGDWRRYTRADPTVRPHVPHVISPGWWKAYAKFLVARKKPNKSNG